MQCNPEISEQAKVELVAEILRSGGGVQIKARGCSMLPAMWPGDLLTVEPLAGREIVRGDIVVVLRDRRFFVHRIVGSKKRNSGSHWITRGDAMPQNDPPAAAGHLLGRVVRICRGGRIFIPSRRVPLIHSGLAWVFCHSNRIRNLALRTHAAGRHTSAYRASL